MNKKILSTGLIAAAVLFGANAALDSQEAEAASKEKCYGVVKAGQNGCADANGTHSCEAQAKTDGSGAEWISLPKGVCEKIVGGSLTPYEGNTKSGKSS